MPRLRTRSTSTPITAEVASTSTSKKSRCPRTVSLAEKRSNTTRKLRSNNTLLAKTKGDEKITPTRTNGGVAKMSGEWEEQEIGADQKKNGHSSEEKKTGNADKENFSVVKHKDFVEEKVTKTPDRRSTFELENSINSVEVLKRDSILENASSSVRGGGVFKKKKRSTENRNLRKKVNIILDDTTPPSGFDFSQASKTLIEDKATQKNDTSVIVVSSDSSADNSPSSPIKERSKKKMDLLKHTLSKKFNANFVEMGRKMPDFAALHKKQFDQMEDIASLTKRKEERAKLLLSGSKPSPLKSRSNNDALRTKLFPQDATKTAEKKRLPSTPKVRFTPETRNSPAVQFTLPKTPKPTPAEVKSYKERRKTKEGFTRYGFKKIDAKEQEKKLQVAVVAKKNNACGVADCKEKRKDLLKGVRTNRRFELLMAMRKGRD